MELILEPKIERAEWIKKYAGMALFKTVYIKAKHFNNNLKPMYKNSDRWKKWYTKLLTHERTHVWQFQQLWLLFYPLYGFEFAIKFLYYWNWEKAYKAISFEREAYGKQWDPSYRRKWYSHITYTFKVGEHEIRKAA